MVELATQLGPRAVGALARRRIGGSVGENGLGHARQCRRGTPRRTRNLAEQAARGPGAPAGDRTGVEDLSWPSRSSADPPKELGMARWPESSNTSASSEIASAWPSAPGVDALVASAASAARTAATSGRPRRGGDRRPGPPSERKLRSTGGTEPGQPRPRRRQLGETGERLAGWTQLTAAATPSLQIAAGVKLVDRDVASDQPPRRPSGKFNGRAGASAMMARRRTDSDTRSR